MSRNITISPGEFYHVYSRGVDKRKVFVSTKDYERFIILLYLCNSRDTVHISNHQGLTLMDFFGIRREDTFVDIGAYCLMPNHFHLLLHEKTDGGISLFMQKLLTAYTMYFNKKNQRNGSLFSGTFKATHANSDEYLKYLLSYIHLNPVKLIDSEWKEKGIKNKTKAKRFLEEYEFSSYHEYRDKNRIQSPIIDKRNFPDYFADVKDFDAFLEDWLNYREYQG